MTLGGDVSRLPSVPRVGLLDGYDVEQPTASRLVTPHPGDPRDAHLLELVPNHPRLHHTLAERIVRRRLARPGAGEDGVVAVVDVLHADHRLESIGARVVAGPFSEGALLLHVAGHGFAFEHDLSVGGDGQTGVLALDDFDRRATEAARVVVLAETVRDLVARRQEKQRVGS